MARARIKLGACRFPEALVVATLAATAPQHLLAAEELIDRLEAEVNGEAITYSEVAEKVKRGNLIEVGAFPALETDPPFWIALQDLINKKLIMQKIEEVGIEISDEKVEAEIESFLSKKGLDRKRLLGALAAEGLEYSQYFDDFKNQMLIKQFQGRFIIPSIKISDKDIELFYFRLLGSSPEGVTLNLRQLFIKIDESATAEVKKAKLEFIESIRRKLKGGMVFEDAVKVYSDAPGASDNGGLMPALSLKDLAPALKSAIEPLEKGDYSEPVKIAGGYYIFYLEDKRLSDSEDFEKKRNELEYRLRQQEMQRETIRWLENQRNQSKIKVISK